MPRIRDFVTVQAKSKIKARDGLANGKYKFFTSSNTQAKWLNEYQYNQPSLIFGTGGMPSIHYCKTPFSTSTDCIVMYAKENANIEVIYHYLVANMHLLAVGFHGAGLQHISKQFILDIEIPHQTEEVQIKVVSLCNLINDLTALRKQQLAQLNNLVQARFVEMFGTITENPFEFPTATLKEVCRKITDGKHGGCKQEADSGYYYVGAREIYDGSIHYDTAPQITYADFAKDYKRCNIEHGDIVIVNTGATIGKTAIATSLLAERTLLQKSVALLKVKPEIICAEFLRHCYMANPSMYSVENASAQPNLLLSKMNATPIYLPPLELQKQFVAFVEQTEKSKLTIRQSLGKLQVLKKLLIQKYFRGE